MFNNPRSIIRRVVMHSLGIAALAMMATPAAQAVGLSNPGSAAAAQPARDALVTHVRGGHGGGGHGGGRGGGGFHGGGFHGGGFRGGGHAFHGGGFRAAPAFRGGGFHRGPAFHGGFARRSFHVGAPYYAHRRPFYRHRYFGPRYYGYAPGYYYGPRRFCRIIRTYYGPRKICRYRPWIHRHHWRRHYRVYW